MVRVNNFEKRTKDNGKYMKRGGKNKKTSTTFLNKSQKDGLRKKTQEVKLKTVMMHGQKHGQLLRLLRDCTETDLKRKSMLSLGRGLFSFSILFFVNKDFTELEHTARKKKGKVVFYFVNITVLRGDL
ncbi:hypothetical protein AMECASPLE_019172 [Ameca splendens]|uniref:Uncharacterized protein n=1 Tax=Ameca splendens TaxID=208324 RepID=A0ABV0YDZ9_9TELE